MAVVNGRVDIQIRTEAAGNAAPKVKAVANEVSGIERAASKAVGPISGVSSAVVGLQKGVGPVESIKTAFDSLTGTFAFVSGVVSLVVAGVSALVDAIGGMESPLSKSQAALLDLRTSTDAWAESLKDAAKQAREVAKQTSAMATSVLDIEAEIAALGGDDEGARQLQALAAWEKAETQYREAVEQRAAQEKELRLEEARLDQVHGNLVEAQRKLALAEEAIVRERRRGHADLAFQKEVERALLLETVDLAEVAERDLARKVEAMRASVGVFDELLGSLGRLVDVKGAAAEKAATPKPPPPRARGGGGRKRMSREDLLAAQGEAEIEALLLLLRQDEEEAELEAELRAEAKRAEERARKALEEARAEEKKLADQRERLFKSDPFRAEAEGMLALSDAVRDFATTMGDGIPMLGAFAGALGSVATAFDGVSAANDNAMKVAEAYREGKASEQEMVEAMADARKTEARAAMDSVGFLAKAGAEQIKNERLRAGVLAVIETGLGLGKAAIGDYAGAAGHFAAAATLGTVAIFGSASSSSSPQQQSRAQDAIAAQTQAQTSMTTVNVYGGWFGASSPQENAWALEQQSRRHAGNGYARAA